MSMDLAFENGNISEAMVSLDYITTNAALKPTLADHGILATLPLRFLISIANPGLFAEPKISDRLNIPSLYLWSSDMRRNFTASDAGGFGDMLKLRDLYGADCIVPVVLFMEQNQELIESADLNEGVIEKLNRGVFARNYRGDSAKLVDGPIFKSVERLNFVPKVEQRGATWKA